MYIDNKLGAFAILLFDALTASLGDLSPSAAAVLTTLHYRPQVTITELAAIAGVAQPTAVRLVDGLVAKGLVERKARVGRETPLALTAQGRKTAFSIRYDRLKAMDRLLSPLSREDRAVLERALDAMLAAATTSRAFARRTCRLCAHDICNEPDCPLGTRASALERAEKDKETAR